MSTIGAFVQRALNRTRRITQPVSASRWLPALAVLATLYATTLGSTARAYPDPANPPAERLQYVIKSVHIRDDQDTFGSGELQLTTEMCSSVADPKACGEGPHIAWHYNFSADSGDTRTFEHVVPTGTDTAEGGATEAAGIPLFASEKYHLFVHMRDEDEFSYDFLGYVVAAVDPLHNWGIGTYTVRSIHNDGSPGDFDVTFEIRRAPLPDLAISSVQEVQSADGLYYCVKVGNIGQDPTPEFVLNISVDGAVLRSPEMPAINAGEETEHCIRRSELSAIQHTLSLDVDPSYKVAEMNEGNNHFEYKLPGLATPVPSPTPMPTKNQGNGKGRADLTIESIQIGGQTPDGKSSCTTKLTVTVKNDGDAAADPFVLRVAVEGSKAAPADKTVTGLDAGQEQAIAFEGIHLDPGEHKIRATADPEHAASESKEGNNERKISARCQPERY